MSSATHLYCGERSVAALPGRAEPFAGRVGWRGLPLHTFTGADSGFRRTLCLHPRRAQRKAQVCGETTIRGDGQGNNKVRRLCWHLIHREAVPLPLEGKDKARPKLGRAFE